jgi:OmpA-OmpF porin, OOP family
MNILQTIRDQLSPELLGQIGKSVDENPAAVKSALDYSIPALLGSAASEAATPQGASNLFNLLKDKAPQGGWPSSTSGLLSFLTGGGKGIGQSLISSLLGSKANLVRDFIASRSGVRTESASSLLGTAGQIVMGLLGKQVATQGLSSSGLGDLLRSQIPHLQGLLPADLAGMLGLGNLVSSGKAGSQQAASYASSQLTPDYESARYAARTGTSSLGKILAFALIPLALLLGIIFLVNRANRQTYVGGTTDRTLTTRSTGMANSATMALPQGDLANFTDRIKTAITSSDGTPIDLQGVTFDTAGNLTTAAKNSLTSLGNMVKDYSNVKVTITAYGPTADEATARANTIRSTLVDLGITEERILVQPEVGDGLPKVRFNK